MSNVFRVLYGTKWFKVMLALITLIVFCGWIQPDALNLAGQLGGRIYLTVSASPELTLFVLPLITLLLGVDLVSALTSSFFTLVTLRAGGRQKVWGYFLCSAFLLAGLLATSVLGASVYFGFINGGNGHDQLLCASLGRFWQQWVDIYAWLLLLTLIQLIFQKTTITFIVGLGFNLSLLAVLKLPTPILRYIPVLPGADVFLTGLSSKVWPGGKYLGLVWVFVELGLIYFWLGRRDDDA